MDAGMVVTTMAVVGVMMVVVPIAVSVRTAVRDCLRGKSVDDSGCSGDVGVGGGSGGGGSGGVGVLLKWLGYGMLWMGNKSGS